MKALTRLPWTAWVTIIALAVWCVWAFDSATHHVAPGLLDDGTFIGRGLRYVQSGYFNLARSDLKAVLRSSTTGRFYELQFALVGLYANLFGLDLRYWYLSNFFLCLLTAGAAFCTVFWLTRNLGAALISLTAVLTVSPLADAARANFGKVEVVMTMLFTLALTSFAAITRLAIEPATSMRMLSLTLAGFCGIVFLGAAVLGKESGRLLAAALPILSILAFVGPMLARATHSRVPSLHRYGVLVVGIGDANPTIRQSQLLVYLVVGALAVVLSFYVYPLRIPNEYLTAYFSLNFEPHYILNGLKFYWQQTWDGIALFGALVPIVLVGFAGRSLIWAFATALTAVAACYMLLLFSFRFHVTYYAYVPTVLVSIAFAAAYAGASSPYRYMMLGVFLLTRIHSIPYIYFQAAGQRYADFVNFQAMKVAVELGAPRIILMDLDEVNQLVQEWNLLRWVYWGGKLPAIFGGRADFQVWDYQQKIRDFGPGIPTRAKDYLPYVTGTFEPKRDGNAEPKVGDLVAARFGGIRAGSIVMRAVMPIRLDELASIAVIDPIAIIPVARVGGAIPAITPFNCVSCEFNFGWQFYRVVSEPRYLIAGQELDGWMQKVSVVHIRQAQPGRRLTMKIDIPAWMPISFPTSITSHVNDILVSKLHIPKASSYLLSVPLDIAGDVKLKAEACVAPDTLPARDPRPLCYLLTGVQVQ